MAFASKLGKGNRITPSSNTISSGDDIKNFIGTVVALDQETARNLGFEVNAQTKGAVLAMVSDYPEWDSPQLSQVGRGVVVELTEAVIQKQGSAVLPGFSMRLAQTDELERVKSELNDHFFKVENANLLASRASNTVTFEANPPQDIEMIVEEYWNRAISETEQRNKDAAQGTATNVFDRDQGGTRR